jgi:23S rRNA pseudouridine1911/1915/1917 synthase
MTDKFLIHSLILPEDAAGLRLDQALAAALPQYSRARLQQWLAAGAVELAGAPAPRASWRVQGGERVMVRAEERDPSPLAGEAMPLDVVYADPFLLVINKPAGLVVHPGAGNRAHTLQNGLLAYDPALARVPRAGLVHRLDKDTTGLMVVARTAAAHGALAAAMQTRTIGREYLALCCGRVRGDGSIDRAIGRHRSQRTRMAVRGDGRAARTHYTVKERFRAHTLLQVRLETGRTHQIRVHMAHLGHPVFGDPVYSGVGGRAAALLLPGATPRTQSVLENFQRQALHAERLRFTHPDSGALLQFRAPLPADLRQLIAVLRQDRRRAEAADAV